jgi:hypothetical protein
MFFRSDEDFEGVIDTIVGALKSLIYINYDTIEYYLNEHISEADDGLSKLEYCENLFDRKALFDFLSAKFYLS